MGLYDAGMSLGNATAIARQYPETFKSAQIGGNREPELTIQPGVKASAATKILRAYFDDSKPKITWDGTSTRVQIFSGIRM